MLCGTESVEISRFKTRVGYLSCSFFQIKSTEMTDRLGEHKSFYNLGDYLEKPLWYQFPSNLWSNTSLTVTEQQTKP